MTLAKSQGVRGRRHWTSEAAEFQFRGMKEKKAKVSASQWCPTVWDSTDCSQSGSSVHGILQARILDWVAILFSRGSSWPRDRTQVAYAAGRFFTIWTTREAPHDHLWKSESTVSTSRSPWFSLLCPAQSRGTQAPASAEGGKRSLLQPHVGTVFLGTHEHPLNLTLVPRGPG